MSTETENTSCNSLAEHCALNGMKRTSIFTAVKEAIASRLGYNRMDPKMENILSQTNKKHQEIIDSSEGELTTEEDSGGVPFSSEEVGEAANDASFDESGEKAA